MQNHLPHSPYCADMCGQLIRNFANQEIGWVKDIVLDPASGRVSHIVMGYSGIYSGSLNGKSVRMPYEAFTLMENAAGQMEYRLNMHKEVPQLYTSGLFNASVSQATHSIF